MGNDPSTQIKTIEKLIVSPCIVRHEAGEFFVTRTDFASGVPFVTTTTLKQLIELGFRPYLSNCRQALILNPTVASNE